MVTANIRFLANRLMADLTCKNSELYNNLQEIGILTPPNIITLDNARTLQIHLVPDDEAGELICSIVNTRKDTLGNVQRLCRYVYCMNEPNRENFLGKIESGEIKTVQQGIKLAEKMREQKNISR